MNTRREFGVLLNQPGEDASLLPCKGESSAYATADIINGQPHKAAQVVSRQVSSWVAEPCQGCDAPTHDRVCSTCGRDHS